MFKKYLLMIVYVIVFIYTLNIDQIPKNIVLFQNENYEIAHLNGIQIKGEKVSYQKRFLNQLTTLNSKEKGTQNIVVSVLGGIFKKDVEVSVLPVTKVKIGGDTVGIKVYSKGVLVIGTAPVQNKEGEWVEPYQKSRIKKGDIILAVNNEKVETIADLIRVVSKASGEMVVQYEQNGNIMEDTILSTPCLEEESNKLGLWVRDGAMGVGTLTFYDVATHKICALGHGISDVDLKQLIDVDEGTIHSSVVVSISKGKRGSPGEIRGLLIEENLIGNIELNNEYGVYGKYDEESNLLTDRPEFLVASKNEISLGEAKMYCTIDENGVPKPYDIKIIRIMNQENAGSKGMVIEVTDEELLEKTGGIIQGMSGSPIVQDDKFVGAVTHVYVNDPTRGYAILAETMLSEMQHI